MGPLFYVNHQTKTMHEKLSSAGRDILKELLAQCTAPQQRMFKLMYGRDNGKRTVEDAEAMDINECVDKMNEKHISTAIDQCDRTVTKNKRNENS